MVPLSSYFIPPVHSCVNRASYSICQNTSCSFQDTLNCDNLSFAMKINNVSPQLSRNSFSHIFCETLIHHRSGSKSILEIDCTIYHGYWFQVLCGYYIVI